MPNVMKICFNVSRFVPCRQTDRRRTDGQKDVTKLVVAFVFAILQNHLKKQPEMWRLLGSAETTVV